MSIEKDPATSAGEDAEAPDDAALEEDGTEDLTEGGRDVVDD